MQIDVLTLTLQANQIERRDVPKLRGYIAGKYPQFIELHNHLGDTEYKYGYPMVQYKSIGGLPTLVALGEACRTIMQISQDMKEIEIENEKMKVYEKSYKLKRENIGESEHIREYKFISPWMALNQDNYIKYIKADEEEKAKLLNSILIGNLLSFSKAFGYRVNNEIKAETYLTPCVVKFKNQDMMAFKGNFKTNFYIPDYLGIGKSVSRGFGTVKAVRSSDE